MRRLLVLGALALVAAGSMAPSSVAKEGVVAKVRVPISRDAAPGSGVTMVWELDSVESGRLRPFSAEGIFLRLIGIDGSRTPRAYATHLGDGRYRATARVPRGGVERVVIGLMGTACDANDCRPAPKRFPVIGRVFR